MMKVAWNAPNKPGELVRRDLGGGAGATFGRAYPFWGPAPYRATDRCLHDRDVRDALDRFHHFENMRPKTNSASGNG